MRDIHIRKIIWMFIQNSRLVQSATLLNIFIQFVSIKIQIIVMYILEHKTEIHDG